MEQAKKVLGLVTDYVFAITSKSCLSTFFCDLLEKKNDPGKRSDFLMYIAYRGEINK